MTSRGRVTQRRTTCLLTLTQSAQSAMMALSGETRLWTKSSGPHSWPPRLKRRTLSLMMNPSSRRDLVAIINTTKNTTPRISLCSSSKVVLSSPMNLQLSHKEARKLHTLQSRFQRCRPSKAVRVSCVQTSPPQKMTSREPVSLMVVEGTITTSHPHSISLSSTSTYLCRSIP